MMSPYRVSAVQILGGENGSIYLRQSPSDNLSMMSSISHYLIHTYHTSLDYQFKI